MCGISGIYTYGLTEFPLGREALERMSESQIHRGPDAGSAWYAERGNVGFAHRRLSIIDLDERANQPMVEPVTGMTIVFNGEIYNYRELRRELIAVGCSFKTGSDTEVLLQAYIHWGEGCLNRLRGMYAFAVWNDKKQTLFLARDPYGIKPLYYVDSEGTFLFASQVKALIASGAVSRQSSPSGLAGFLMMGSVPEPHTIYRDIFSLPAGCYMIVDAAGVGRIDRHFSVSGVWLQAAYEPTVLNDDDLQVLVADAISDSVKLHMIADVPVGAFLSAGIDSGTLLALMSEQHSVSVQSITLGFGEFRGTQNDETLLSAQIAKRYGSRHTIRWIEDQEIERDLPAILSAMDQPTVDGVNTWLVSKVAHEEGLKVVLSGVGGDELFGGYTHFEVFPMWKRSQAIAHLLPGVASLAATALIALSRLKVVPPKAAALVRYGESYAGLYFAKRGLFMPWELPSIMGRELAEIGLKELKPPDFLADALGPEPVNGYAAIAALESIFYLRNQLLRDSDWASMAHSLELRTPLVDSELLNALAPALVKRPARMEKKVPLANAPVKALPSSIIERPKTGFTLPMGRYIENSEVLDSWRGIPALREEGSHWSRRMAYSLVSEHIKSG